VGEADEESKELVPPPGASEDEAVRVVLKTDEGLVQFTNATLQVTDETHRTFLDMSPEHALTTREVARLQFAVPEQERTARSRQQTVRQAITAVVVVLGFIAMYCVPEASKEIVGLVVVLGGGLVFGEFFNREKKKLPPAKD
jgi:plastocyanin